MLPVHLGHWRTVYGWFLELARRFLFQTIHDVELMLDRERAGRDASPTAAVMDSHPAKASGGHEGMTRASDRWPQAACRRGYGWPLVDGEPDDGRYLG